MSWYRRSARQLRTIALAVSDIAGWSCLRARLEEGRSDRLTLVMTFAHISNADVVVVVSSAIDRTNPEVGRAL